MVSFLRKLISISYSKYFSFCQSLITYNWLLISWLTKLIHKKVNISPTILNNKIKKIFFIVPNDKNYLIYKSPSNRHPDTLGKIFLEKITGAAVNKISLDEIDSLKNDGETVVATWLAGTDIKLNWYIYYLRIIKLAIKLRQKRIPVIVFVCDTYYPDASAIAVTLTSITGGVSIFLQNSKKEIRNFGYTAFVWPAFWVPQILEIYNSTSSRIPWQKRKNVCMLASGLSSTPLRTDLMNRLGIYMQQRNYELLPSMGNFEKQEYIDLLGTVKFYATTNFVQEVFHIGGKRYRSKMSETTTTGRTWNAFAAGMVLIANKTDNLSELGFFPNVHYLDLIEILENPSCKLPSDSELTSIAENGRRHLTDLMNTRFNFSNVN